MSAWAAIATAEAIVATRIAIEEILRADRWRSASMRWRRHACDLGNQLAAEREANLLHHHLHRLRTGVGAQETTEPG